MRPGARSTRPRVTRRTACIAVGITGLVALGAALFLTVSPAPAAESAAASATAPAGHFPVDSRSEFHALNPILRFLEDPAGKLAVEDVSKPEMQARFRSTPNTHGPVNFGYSRSAFWLRIPLALDADTPSRWQLEIAFAALDRVEVYTRRAGGGVDVQPARGFDMQPARGFVMQTAGDLQPFSARPFAYRNLVFPLTLEPGCPTACS